MLTPNEILRQPINIDALRAVPEHFALGFNVLPTHVSTNELHVILPAGEEESTHDLLLRIGKFSQRNVTYDTADSESLRVAIRFRYSAINSKIRNCAKRFLFKCPMRWEKLEETDQHHVRFCYACTRQVHFCFSDKELKLHAGLGNCVAVYNVDTKLTLSGIVIGNDHSSLDQQV